jgi:hypothetical protein
VKFSKSLNHITTYIRTAWIFEVRSAATVQDAFFTAGPATPRSNVVGGGTISDALFFGHGTKEPHPRLGA